LSNHRKLGLDDAYSVETPEDNKRLYADWASTYESEFVTDHGYVGYLRVVEQLASHIDNPDAHIVDVGCGTGVCGAALAGMGFRRITGLDISAEMLEEAARKRRDDDGPVYSELLQTDLTRRAPVDDDAFQGLVCAGTFTHGHLGPESLEELWRMTTPGGICSIGINASHYDTAGFAERIAADEQRSVISVLGLIEVETYTKPQADVTPGNDRANVLVCQVNGCG